MTALPGASPHAHERIRSTARREVSLTRRSLLHAGALGAAVTVVGLRPWAAAPATAAPGHLLRSSYDGRVGEGFRVASADLRLLSVDDLASAAVDRTLVRRKDAFALTFAGPMDAALEGATHSISHPALGSFKLFVAEVGQPRAERRYEAVIDRSVHGPRSARRRAAAAAQPPAPSLTRMVRRIALHRTPSGARADVLLATPAGSERVLGRLSRNGKTIAVAAGDVRRGRAPLHFRGARGLGDGTYTVTLVLVDSAGVTSVRRRRVSLT